MSHYQSECCVQGKTQLPEYGESSFIHTKPETANTVQRVVMAHQKTPSTSHSNKGNKTMSVCKSIGCIYPAAAHQDFCLVCLREHALQKLNLAISVAQSLPDGHSQSLAEKYPKYYKAVGDLQEVDVYAVHKLFDIQDPSGAIQHASKKLLLSGVRTGGKSQQKDIREARDTLSRWLQLNPETV